MDTYQHMIDFRLIFGLAWNEETNAILKYRDLQKNEALFRQFGSLIFLFTKTFKLPLQSLDWVHTWLTFKLPLQSFDCVHTWLTFKLPLQSFDCVHTWWRSLQKCTVHTKLGIYVFFYNYLINTIFSSHFHSRRNSGFFVYWSRDLT
jgi:hypothetical protein